MRQHRQASSPADWLRGFDPVGTAEWNWSKTPSCVMSGGFGTFSRMTQSRSNDCAFRCGSAGTLRGKPCMFCLGAHSFPSSRPASRGHGCQQRPSPATTELRSRDPRNLLRPDSTCQPSSHRLVRVPCPVAGGLDWTSISKRLFTESARSGRLHAWGPESGCVWGAWGNHALRWQAGARGTERDLGQGQ